MTAPFVVREAIVTRDGNEFRAGDRLHIVTRTGTDDEAFSVLTETLRENSPVEASDFLLYPTPVSLERGVLTIITARERDPELWAALEAVSTA